MSPLRLAICRRLHQIFCGLDKDTHQLTKRCKYHPLKTSNNDEITFGKFLPSEASAILGCPKLEFRAPVGALWTRYRSSYLWWYFTCVVQLLPVTFDWIAPHCVAEGTNQRMEHESSFTIMKLGSWENSLCFDQCTNILIFFFILRKANHFSYQWNAF